MCVSGGVGGIGLQKHQVSSPELQRKENDHLSMSMPTPLPRRPKLEMQMGCTSYSHIQIWVWEVSVQREPLAGHWER